MTGSTKPLAYLPPLSGERLAAYESMPTLNGHVVNLFYVPQHLLAGYEDQWRQWLMSHDRHLWPEWVDQWSRARQARSRKVA